MSGDVWIYIHFCVSSGTLLPPSSGQRVHVFFAQVGVDATDPFSLAEALDVARPEFAAASDSILVATAHGAGGAVSEAIGFLLSNETNVNATDDVRCFAHP